MGSPLGSWGANSGQTGKGGGGVRATFAGKTNVKRAKMTPSPDPLFPADPPDPAEMVHGLQQQTSPLRAGGKDDVSSNKLPQLLSDVFLLYIYIYIYIYIYMCMSGCYLLYGIWEPLDTFKARECSRFVSDGDGTTARVVSDGSKSRSLGT